MTLVGILAVVVVAASCSNDSASNASESSEPPDAIVPLIQLLEFGADQSYQAAYEVERPDREQTGSSVLVDDVSLDTEALGVEAEDANVVVSHTPDALRLDFVRLDQAVSLYDVEDAVFSCASGTVADTCGELSGSEYIEKTRPVGGLVPSVLAVILSEEQDWKGAEVEVEPTSVEIDGLPSTCATIRGVDPALLGGAEDIDEWELCVSDDGVLARYDAGDVHAELVDFRAGVPEELLEVPDDTDAQPDDPVLAVALDVDTRLRSLAGLEGESQSPHEARFLEQVEGENLAVRLVPSDDFEEDGRVTVLTGRGVACLVVPESSDGEGEAERGVCAGFTAP